MIRHDYTFPFRVDPASHQAAQARSYEAHVEQMIRQVLLTDRGERTDLPDFGCGLRQLLFAPHSDALTATTKIHVQQALNRWLAGQIQVQEVTVTPPGATSEAGELLDQAELLVRVDYLLVETLMNRQFEVRVT